MKELLTILRKNDIHLDIVKGELSVKFPKGKIDQELLSEIKVRKSELISYLISLDKNSYEGIPTAPVKLHYPMSSSQKRLWILSQFEQGSQAYNMPGVYVFEGELKICEFELAFDHLIKRHEILRTVFAVDENEEIRQWVKSGNDHGFKINYHDVRDEVNKDEAILHIVQENTNAKFELDKGPLLRAVLIHEQDNNWVFGFTMHHIISDGWSMGIMIKELLTLYNSYSQGKSPALKPLRIQYKDYSVWQQEQLSGDSLKSRFSIFRANLPFLSFNPIIIDRLLKHIMEVFYIRKLIMRPVRNLNY
jgi:hypothetical protein